MEHKDAITREYLGMTTLSEMKADVTICLCKRQPKWLAGYSVARSSTQKLRSIIALVSKLSGRHTSIFFRLFTSAGASKSAEHLRFEMGFVVRLGKLTSATSVGMWSSIDLP